jgi:glycosyltransferase involved in cell wall biosynthesis
MKVMHLIAPISFGGGESLLVNLLKENQLNEVSESVLLLYSSPKFEAELKKNSIPFSVLQKASLGHGISKLQMAVRSLSLLFKFRHILNVIREQEINIIHAHGYPASIIFFILKSLFIQRIKGVYTHHFNRDRPSRISQFVFSKVYSSFDACTGVSNLVSHSMNESFPQIKSRFNTIYNCIGIDFLLPASESNEAVNKSNFPPSRNKKIFIQVARFINCKNQILVVKSLQKLSQEQRDKLHIVFVGDGAEKQSVVEFVKDNYLEDTVSFTGAIPYNEVRNILNKADFGLFPSENEGFGIAAVECLAAGLPVLSLDTELMKEVISYAGLQVSRDELHLGLLRIIDEFANSSDVARQRAEDFRPELIKKQYCNLYLQISGGI